MKICHRGSRDRADTYEHTHAEQNVKKLQSYWECKQINFLIALCLLFSSYSIDCKPFGYIYIRTGTVRLQFTVATLTFYLRKQTEIHALDKKNSDKTMSVSFGLAPHLEEEFCCSSKRRFKSSCDFRMSYFSTSQQQNKIFKCSIRGSSTQTTHNSQHMLARRLKLL